MIEKPCTKCLSKIHMLRKLPFYDELNIVKMTKAFIDYARSYTFEDIDSKDPPVQLTVSRPSIKRLFNNLLCEFKGFKYQITLKKLESGKLRALCALTPTRLIHH